jgi:ribosomal protein L37AE/L43A
MTEKKETEKTQKHRCKKCNSTFGYLRIKDGEFVCRSCGFVEKEGVGE